MGYRPKHMAYSPRNELAFRLGMAAAISTTLAFATPAFGVESSTVPSAATQTPAVASADEAGSDNGSASLSAAKSASMTGTSDAAIQKTSTDSASKETATTAADEVKTKADMAAGSAATATAATVNEKSADGLAQDSNAASEGVSRGNAVSSASEIASEASTEANEDSLLETKNASEVTPIEGASVGATSATAASDVSATMPSISVEASVPGKGTIEAGSGEVAGTTGESKKVDSITLHLIVPDDSDYSDNDIEYRAHVSNIGWQDWTTAGKAIGAKGSGEQIEAVQFKLRDGSNLAAGWRLWMRAHVENYGWLAWTCDGPVGSTGQGLRLEAIEAMLLRTGVLPDSDKGPSRAPAAKTSGSSDSSSSMTSFIDGTDVELDAHVENDGWEGWVKEGQIAGTTGEGKRLEAIRAKVENAYANGDVEIQAHVEDDGWQNWKDSSKYAGTVGKSKRIEAVRMQLTGDLANLYDIWYRVHVQTIGWMAWTKNGLAAGTTGVSGRMEAVEVFLTRKGASAPADDAQGTTITFIEAPEIDYKAHVQIDGWQAPVSDGAIAGTTGESKRIEAMTIQFASSQNACPGGVMYRAHVQNDGWQNWVSNGAVAGTTGQAKRLEAFQIELTGEIAKYFDVYYQAHVANVGWQNWVANGGVAGTQGMKLAVEAYKVKIVLKGNEAPGATTPRTGLNYCWLKSSPYWSGTVKQMIMNIHYSDGRYDEATETQHVIKQIVIHHNAGTLNTEGCYSTWQTRAASAHYEVEANGTVGQLVYDSDTAWHAGNWYENLDSIGIEHADAPGSSSSHWYLTEATINSGAKLVALLCIQYGLGRPTWGVNVVGHNDVSSTECPASLGKGGSQHNEYMSKAQYWYDIIASTRTA